MCRVLDQFVDSNFTDMYGKGNTVKLVSMSVKGVMVQRHNIRTALIPLLPASGASQCPPSHLMHIPNGEHPMAGAHKSQVPQHENFFILPF
jgi:hypothetical protein